MWWRCLHAACGTKEAALACEHSHQLLEARAPKAPASCLPAPPQARLLQELPSLKRLPGENVRLAAAQLAAFVPCSILEAGTPEGEAGTAGGGSLDGAVGDGGAGGGNGCGGNGNGDGSDAEMVVVEAPGRASSSGGSLEALPAEGGEEGALVVVPTGQAALRLAAVAYLDGLVAQVGVAWMGRGGVPASGATTCIQARADGDALSDRP